ncbi:hypothetical protein GBAR_LOCUS2822 [Geodia barretti]|uniref:Uncharacterized protein n=1 Tax=Geodia barretti TaxID=519541 RepID=A0AA35R0Y8_GEOBA|nr:hypothetical protein GBAR_LOCUS2822 [Geodia barretti]
MYVSVFVQVRYLQEQCVETKAKRRRRGRDTAWHIHQTV